MENTKKDLLLEFFGVKNHRELLEYMENNPDDKNVLLLKEIMDGGIQNEE